MKITLPSVMTMVFAFLFSSVSLIGSDVEEVFCFDADVPDAQMDFASMCLTAPFIMCPSTYFGCPNDNLAPANTGQATATPGDVNCPTPSLEFTDVTVTNTPCLKVIHRTWDAFYTGAANIKLHSSCQQTIYLEDNANPVISGCPSNMTVDRQNNCQGIATWSVPTATDNCGLNSFNTTHLSGTAFPDGTTTVTYTAVDNCGMSATCSFTVTVTGNCCTAPTINCPGTYVACGGSTDVSVTGTANASTGDPSMCGTPTVNFSDVVNSTSSCGSVITRTFVASSASGTVSCNQTINTSDTNIPVISGAPGDMTFTGTGNNCSVPVTWNEPIATDACGIASFGSNISNGTSFTQGSTLVTYTAVDNCGNQTTHAFQVTVNCTTPCSTNPTINCPSTYTACPMSGVPSTSVSGNAVANSTGGCTGSPTITFSDNVNSTGTTGCPSQQIIRTFTATDPGNSSLSASCTQTINLVDTNGPTITGMPANMTLTGTGPGCTGAATWTPPTASDFCGTANLSSNFSPGAQFPAGSTVVTYTAVDNCGNTNTLSFTISVTCNNPVCTTPPTISCPSNYTACPTSGTPGPNVAGQAFAQATGPNCGTPTVTFNDVISNSGSCQNSKVIQRTWSANSSGFTSSCVQMINLVDNQAPFFQVGCPSTINLTGVGTNCSAVGSWTIPTASDNCSGATVSSTHSVGSSFSAGSTLVTYTASDVCGNNSTCAFNVNVTCQTCNTNPVISCPSSRTVCVGSSSSPSILGTATATGGSNCPTPSVNFSDLTVNSGNCGGQVITRTWTANYAGMSGFSASCVQTINLVDNTSPTIFGCPANMTVSSASVPVTWVAPTANDACGTANLSSNFNSGSTFPHGTTTVIYTAADACGNTSTCSFTVTVNAPQGGFQNCPNDVVVSCGSNGGASAHWTPPTYNGACTSCDDGGYIAGFIYMGSFGGSQFYCSLSPATYTTAKSISANHGGHLADINSASENAFLANQLQLNSAWIGLSDYQNEGHFEWCSGAPLNYTNWFPGQPNNFNGAQDHCEMLKDGTWNDQYNTYSLEFIMELPCSNITQTSGPAPGTHLQSGTYPVTYTLQDACGAFATCNFNVIVEAGLTVSCPANVHVNASTSAGAVCNWSEPSATSCCSNCGNNAGGHIPGFFYMGSHGGSHYYCSLAPSTWSNARQSCISLGGNLAVINSAAENAFLANGLQANSAWIGCHDSATEGHYQWVDGSPFNYSNWFAGQPNNFNGTQDFVEILKSGEWNDQYATVSLEYVLEISNCITTTQIAGPTRGSVCPPGVHTVTYNVQDGCGNSKTCSFTVTVNAPAPPPPTTGYCTTGGAISNHHYIQSCTFNTISNTSGNNGGYKNFTNLCTTVEAGHVYPLQLSPGFGGSQPSKVYWTCWIDYNMDGDFYDNYELVAYGCGSKTLSGTITVPYGVWNGTARMRCTMSTGGYVTDPCSHYAFGETEDYCVKVTGADFTGTDTGELSLRNNPWDDATDLSIPDAVYDISVYPNPVNEVLTLELSNTAELTNLELIAMDGKSMKVIRNISSMTEVNVSDIANGIYMVRASYIDGSLITEKVIVQH